MRAPSEQVRHAAADAVGTARDRASGLVHTGADLVGGGVERVVENLPDVPLVPTPPRRHRLRTALLVVGVLVVVLAVAKKLLSQMDDDLELTDRSDPADEPAVDLTTDIGDTDDPDGTQVAAGSG